MLVRAAALQHPAYGQHDRLMFPSPVPGLHPPPSQPSRDSFPYPHCQDPAIPVSSNGLCTRRGAHRNHSRDLFCHSRKLPQLASWLCRCPLLPVSHTCGTFPVLAVIVMSGYKVSLLACMDFMNVSVSPNQTGGGGIGEQLIKLKHVPLERVPDGDDQASDSGCSAFGVLISLGRLFRGQRGTGVGKKECYYHEFP